MPYCTPPTLYLWPVVGILAEHTFFSFPDRTRCIAKHSTATARILILAQCSAAVPLGRTYRHDLMFSGHTLAFHLLAELFDVRGSRCWKAARFAAKYVLPFTLAWSRQHYTVDVLVAMAVFGQVR